MTSLQARLSTGLIVALALLTVLAVVIGGYSLRQLAEDFVAGRVEHPDPGQVRHEDARRSATVHAVKATAGRGSRSERES